MRIEGINSIVLGYIYGKASFYRVSFMMIISAIDGFVV